MGLRVVDVGDRSKELVGVFYDGTLFYAGSCQVLSDGCWGSYDAEISVAAAQKFKGAVSLYSGARVEIEL